MTVDSNIPQYGDDHYAVVDLGSNSFHLLITQLINDEVYIVNKVKQKVRLASGLDHQNFLNQEAINRGLKCLSLFAKHLASIPKDNIKIVATATLRIATNAEDFLQTANNILPLPINILSGIQEAHTIYAGASCTSAAGCSLDNRLVLDIGGASTELIVGKGCSATQAVSLNIGCVSYKSHHFSDNLLNEENFSKAIAAASFEINTVAQLYIQQGWQIAMGSSGTMQALVEILSHQNKEPVISLSVLEDVKNQLLGCQQMDKISIAGLRADRIPVLASGLSILIALFNCLNITELVLSTGALREGLLFSILPERHSLTLLKK
ncbi:phosphatase [Litorilituus lipolyticus]|uniref:Phosphatase n=1 Tax=Litorilituus lipolyticus TaxID=2491017 RepID=A0A502KW25_9GAMM|nr:phosphatase [Litorilituus lipolyticus]TPH15686.1 phosphatase [Litorilituus lipolyticus]